jgi:CoA:oxalate CoA-transferase
VNMKTPEGAEICRRLATEWADVLVENFTPGTMANFGLDYPTLSEQNPRLIYASLSGYGQNTPMSTRRAYDICVQSESGLTAMNGEQGRRPHRIGYSAADYGAGRDMVIGILAALFFREKTGRGQQVDASMFDTCVSLTENAIPRYSMKGELSQALGSRHPAASPHNLYKTKDGHINIIAVENRLFHRLARAMGRVDLIDHPLFGDPEGRLQNVDEMDRIIEAWTTTKTTREVAEELDSNGLPYGILNDICRVIESEHTTLREMAPAVEQTALGPVRVPGCPIKLSASEAKVRGPAPMLGEHNREVLQGVLGYSDDEYRGFVARGVLSDEE